ncbi:MAG TPA: MBL fold metallo-hydrolase [Syntrophobacteraceae bacterium]|nr:MBL fold metallo-hydrolase [Syntrophobacteraceae bacterium]
MDWKITVLCENTVASPGFLGEHGFAALVETPEETILFDTGQGFGLVQNALRLQKDLRRVTRLVLSHGHFDHTGGLLSFLGIHGPCDVTAHPDVLVERFRWMPVGSEEKPLSIGIPWHEAYLTTRGARFRWQREFAEISPNVFISGEVPRKTAFETGDPKFVVRKNGQWAPDPFLDDYSLFVVTPRGLIVLLGCAHAGLINILNHAVEKTGEERIHAIVGGTHLGFSPEVQTEDTLRALRKYRIEVLATSHCTGQRPVARLAAEFGDRFAFGHVGFVLGVFSG